MKNPVKLGGHAVQYFFNKTLAEYREKPHGSPYEAFYRCYNSMPENMDAKVRLNRILSFDFVVFDRTRERLADGNVHVVQSIKSVE